jgi:hypothetical protein
LLIAAIRRVYRDGLRIGKFTQKMVKQSSRKEFIDNGWALVMLAAFCIVLLAPFRSKIALLPPAFVPTRLQRTAILEAVMVSGT